jgi:ATP-dependent DNA ligase
MESRINKRLDQGYRRSIEEARENVGNNAMDLQRPMLAQQFDKIRAIDYTNCFIQKKYNGHRCLITNQGKGNIAYSRNGKPITTIDHILRDIDLDEGETIDGELYIHDTSLQQLGSLIRRKQTGSNLLQYVAYDIMANLPYSCRLDMLNDLFLGNNVSIAPTELYTPKTSLRDRLEESIEGGYEGLILRHGRSGYEAGKRSSSLVKVKKFMDAEFLVVNVEPSKDGWGILVCRLENGNTFKVPAPGTMANKMHIYKNRHEFIGLFITVEFFEWTDSMVPFHPRATNWRDE